MVLEKKKKKKKKRGTGYCVPLFIPLFTIPCPPFYFEEIGIVSP